MRNDNGNFSQIPKMIERWKGKLAKEREVSLVNELNKEFTLLRQDIT